MLAWKSVGAVIYVFYNCSQLKNKIIIFTSIKTETTYTQQSSYTEAQQINTLFLFQI